MLNNKLQLLLTEVVPLLPGWSVWRLLLLGFRPPTERNGAEPEAFCRSPGDVWLLLPPLVGVTLAVSVLFLWTGRSELHTLAPREATASCRWGSLMARYSFPHDIALADVGDVVNRILARRAIPLESSTVARPSHPLHCWGWVRPWEPNHQRLILAWQREPGWVA